MITSYKPQQQLLAKLQKDNKQLFDFLSTVDGYLTTVSNGSTSSGNTLVLDTLITQATTISFGKPATGQLLAVIIQQDAVGHAVAWSSTFVNTPAIDVAPSSITTALFVGRADGTWYNILSLSGVTSFNTRTGAVTLLNSDVTTAVGQALDTSGSPTYRGINLSNLSTFLSVIFNPVLFASLASPPAGFYALAFVSDNSTATLGNNAAGGGALKSLLWWNGTNWTVVTK